METVCCLVLTTTGTQGENLGSDETDIVLLGYTLINVARNQVLGIQEYVVLPKEAEASSNFLSDEVRECTRLTEAAVRTSGVSLEKAIQLFGNFCSSLGVSPYSTTFITDGQLPLRQCLHPESVKKNLHLPAYYNAFADLRKSVVRFYQTDSVFTSISDILTFLDIPNADDTSFFCKELRDMVNIVQRVISDGHKFISDETIQISLEPGICSKDEEVDSATVVRARGLPWQSSDQDIAKFFRGLNLAKGGVALCLSPMGRRNGEALVRFSCAEHREMALRRHKHHISTRYIEVYRATGEDFVNVAGGSSNEAQAFLTKGAQVIIRMRGLPYDCTAKQVMEFFAGGEDGGCEVMGGEEGVLFVRRPDGRSTGDAFVLFRREEDAPKALSRHRQSIGVRYIELFRSTTAEVQQVLNRTLEESASSSANSSTTAGGGSVQLPLAPLPPILAQLPLLPQHIITSGTSKDCIRLRGLPYEAQVEHILEFLGEHAKHILFQGVHMVFNSQGQPSGEAFIQMDSEASAASAAQLRHHKNMVFGKKQRYIEVWQCSGEDMSLVLSGASGEQASPQALPQPPPTPVSPPQTQQAGIKRPALYFLPPPSAPKKPYFLPPHPPPQLPLSFQLPPPPVAQFLPQPQFLPQQTLQPQAPGYFMPVFPRLTYYPPLPPL